MSDEALISQGIQGILGNFNAATLGADSSAIVNVYQLPSSFHVDATKLEAARQLLAELPLTTTPDVATLPPSSLVKFGKNPDFTGREDALQKVATMLKGDENALKDGVRTVAVTGIGGVGKTQLANAFVHRYGQYFAGGVFWITMADTSMVSGEIARCYPAISSDMLPYAGDMKSDDRIQLVVRAWQSPLPRLLVFDNCEDEELLQQWLPRTGSCRVLITSRRPEWTAELDVQVLPLDVFKPQDSIALLYRYRSDLADAARAKIADELGHLPLALHLAGSFLKAYRSSSLGNPDVYLSELRTKTLLQHPSLQGQKPGRVRSTVSATHHEQSIERTFAMSYDLLDASDPIDAQALALLERAAYFAPGELIPRTWLKDTLQITDEDSNIELEVEDALWRLVDTGLLEIHKQEAFRLHKLLSAFMHMRIQSTREAQMSVEKVLQEKAERLMLDLTSLPPLLELQPHLRAVADAALASRDERAINLCLNLSNLMRFAGSYAEGCTYLTQATMLSERIFGSKSLSTVVCLSLLAQSYSDQGQYKQAEVFLQQALAIYESFPNPNPLMAIVVLLSSTLVQSMLGQYDQAETHGLHALAICEVTQGSDDVLTILALFLLTVLYYMQDRYALAETLALRALASCKKTLVATHVITGYILNCLAAIYSRRGEFEQAQELFQQRILPTLEHDWGEEHPFTLFSRLNLANTYSDQDQSKEAAELYQNILTLLVKIFGPDHPFTATTSMRLAEQYFNQEAYVQAQTLLQNALPVYEKMFASFPEEACACFGLLAISHLTQENYDQAESFLLHALTLAEQLLKPEHQAPAMLLKFLVMFYERLERYEEAESALLRLIALTEKAAKPDYSYLIEHLEKLAELHMDQERYERAEALLRRALAIQEHVLGSDHEKTIKSILLLGHLYFAQQQFALALPLYEHVRVAYEQSLNPDNPLMADILWRLGICNLNQGLYVQADALLQHVLVLQESHQQLDDANLIILLNSLVSASIALGHYAQAEPLAQRALALSEQVQERDPLSTVLSLNNLAELYRIQAQPDQAEPLYLHAIDIVEQVNGHEHPDVATFLNNLALLYLSQQRYEQAEKLFQRALALVEHAATSDEAIRSVLLKNLAILYYAQDRYAQAEPLAQEALTYYENAPGAIPLHFVDNLNILASLYNAQGRYDQAEPLLQSALAAADEFLGYDSPQTLSVLENRVQTLKVLQRTDEAVKLEARIRSIQEGKGYHAADNGQ